ncbi:MAG: YkgJ family cysteine cluster protein [Bryobacteraceae bacterium]|nr:YkgJ family cysteine cluster protein [Bryobacteraceae bacterium]
MNRARMVEFEVQFGDSVLDASAVVPEDPIPAQAMLPLFRSMSDAFVEFGRQVAEAEGETISCREGCAHCCRQLVPMSALEALEIGDWIAQQPAGEQAALKARFEETARKLAANGLNTDAGYMNGLEQQQLRAYAEQYIAAYVDCPFLRNERCSIYEIRPMACREYLVTSPAENCRRPSPETIRRMPVPARFGAVLPWMPNGRLGEGVVVFPLPGLLDWLARERGRARPPVPGTEIFENAIEKFRQK